jgi:hypothetical protein
MKTPNVLGLGLGLAISSMAFVANAQDTITGGAGRADRSHVVTPHGASVAVGGGVANFFRESVRDMTGVSATWDARLTYGTRSLLGGEVAYVGGTRSVTASGLASDASLFNNGVEAALRVNAPFGVNGFLLEPFALAGVGVNHYYLRNTANTSTQIANTDNIGTVPLGLGFAFGWQGLLADARVVYRPTFDDAELVKSNGNGNTDLQSWSANLTVGFEF